LLFDQAVSTGDVNTDADVFQLIRTHQVAFFYICVVCVCGLTCKFFDVDNNISISGYDRMWAESQIVFESYWLVSCLCYYRKMQLGFPRLKKLELCLIRARVACFQLFLRFVVHAIVKYWNLLIIWEKMELNSWSLKWAQLKGVVHLFVMLVYYNLWLLLSA
jgi:hypothetical protein